MCIYVYVYKYKTTQSTKTPQTPKLPYLKHWKQHNYSYKCGGKMVHFVHSKQQKLAQCQIQRTISFSCRRYYENTSLKLCLITRTTGDGGMK